MEVTAMAATTATTGAPMLTDEWVYVLLLAPPLLGLIWAAKAWSAVEKCKLDGHPDNLLLNKDRAAVETQLETMNKVAKLISDGAMTFLITEYYVMAAFIVVFAGILVFFTNLPTTVAFVVGAVTSILCGWVGMKIAVKTNVKTTHSSWSSLQAGFEIALEGGTVMGMSLVSMAVLGLIFVIKVFQWWQAEEFSSAQKMYECIAGYGLGGSSIALFGRVGGGIYTKAADVGADLSGKNGYGLNEDDIRNPACIADNVGDNVGDIAGMGADLFGSFAESTCAALVLAAHCEALNQKGHIAPLMFPVLISTVGIAVGVLTLIVRSLFYKVASDASVEKALKGVLVISTVLMTPAVIGLSKVCLPEVFHLDDDHKEVQWWYCAIAIIAGLWSGLVIGFITEYYTSHSYEPVRSIAKTQMQSAATGVILGLALGYLSCIIPTFCLALTILLAHTLCGMFGVALSALGMLGTLTMGLTIDAYGPISDNAGGIAEMSLLPDEVRDRTDCLDAAGNTTAAIGKGFAIGSAALVSLALFGAFCTRANIKSVDILDVWVFSGLLLGAMMPYAFAAWTMQSVGMAANDMVEECNSQFPGIMERGVEPDYAKCIQISTNASLKEMIRPGALVILSPLVAGLGFGKNACAGLLSGSLVSAVQLAISMSNSGGAWDNSKKWISAGGLGEEHRKGSDAHANSVTGDTVGDPLKDTSGPALNIVMKLTAIISLVFGSAILDYSNADGGPFWLPSNAVPVTV